LHCVIRDGGVTYLVEGQGMQGFERGYGRPRFARRGGALGGAAVGLALVATGVAVAQEESPAVLQKVVVEAGDTGKGDRVVGPDRTIVATESATATKTGTPIIETPAAVSVVTQKEIEAQGAKDLQEAISYTAGVLVDEFGSDNRYDYFRIRGFDETALGSYRDGLPARIPAWFTASRSEPYGMQRIEVLKGSNSTLFGLNAPGGIVNAITKRPQDIRHGEIYTTLGAGHTEVGADFGGPIDENGVFSYRLTGYWQDADFGGDNTRDDHFYIAPALTISPDAGTNLTILGDYGVQKKDGGGGGAPQGIELDRDTFLGEPDFNRFNTTQGDLGYLFEHQFDGGLIFRSSARYTDVALDYAVVYGASTDPTASRWAFSVDGHARRIATDNQLQYDASWGSFDSKFLVGIDYTNDDTREEILFGTAGGIDIYNPTYCGLSCITLGPYVNWRVKQEAIGAYAQEQLTFDDRWILTVGGRYDYVHTVTDYLDYGTRDDETARNFSPRAGLTYKVNESLAAYVNYSESFQPLVSPTANGYSAVSGSLKPQTGTQYEAGLKYRPAGFDGLFTLAVFDLSQTNVPTYVSPTEQRQIGEVNVKGVELEAKVALNEQLNLTAAYSYWHAQIVEDGGSGNEGNRPDRVPEHIASLWADYTFPGEGRRGDLTVGGGVRYVGQTFGDAANTDSIDGYVVVDAMAKYEVSDGLTLAVNAKNLFDKRYVSTCYYGTCYYGDRREVLVTLKRTW